METYYGLVKTPADAIKLFEACRLGFLPRVQRRLSEKERSAIRSGSVFVWDEREAGMRRWTDGKSWSASRVAGSFLTYREMEGKRSAGFGTVGALGGPGTGAGGGTGAGAGAGAGGGGSGGASGATGGAGGARKPASKPSDSRISDEEPEEGEPDGYRYKTNGLMKQSFSITTNTGNHLHLISYSSRQQPGDTPLPLVSDDTTLATLVPPKGMYPESSMGESTQGPALTRAPMASAYAQHPHHHHPPPQHLHYSFAQQAPPHHHHHLHHQSQQYSQQQQGGYAWPPTPPYSGHYSVAPGPYQPQGPPPSHHHQMQQQHQQQHQQHQHPHPHQHQHSQSAPPPPPPPIQQSPSHSHYSGQYQHQHQHPPPPPQPQPQQQHQQHQQHSQHQQHHQQQQLQLQQFQQHQHQQHQQQHLPLHMQNGYERVALPPLTTTQPPQQQPPPQQQQPRAMAPFIPPPARQYYTQQRPATPTAPAAAPPPQHHQPQHQHQQHHQQYAQGYRSPTTTDSSHTVSAISSPSPSYVLAMQAAQAALGTTPTRAVFSPGGAMSQPAYPPHAHTLPPISTMAPQGPSVAAPAPPAPPSSTATQPSPSLRTDSPTDPSSSSQRLSVSPLDSSQSEFMGPGPGAAQALTRSATSISALLHPTPACSEPGSANAGSASSSPRMGQHNGKMTITEDKRTVAVLNKNLKFSV